MQTELSPAGALRGGDSLIDRDGWLWEVQKVALDTRRGVVYLLMREETDPPNDFRLYGPTDAAAPIQKVVA